MRKARLRYDQELCYYHLMNRVVGEETYFPFGEVEKEYFFRLAVRLTKLYILEVLSLVVMSNHYHILVAAPAEVPDAEKIKSHWRAYYDNGNQVEPNWEDEETVTRWGMRMRDISCFIKDLQQQFTMWFNRTRSVRRRGTLWAGRFKNSIIEKQTVLRDCFLYVEMNPVRAGLCADPGDYRFGTWGRYKGSGKHPFHENVVRHLGSCFGMQAHGWDGARLLAEWNAVFARVGAVERGEDLEKVSAAAQTARGSESFVLTAKRRVRYLSEGAILGSQAFILHVMRHAPGSEKTVRRKLVRARRNGVDTDVYAWRHLRAIG